MCLLQLCVYFLPVHRHMCPEHIHLCHEELPAYDALAGAAFVTGSALGARQHLGQKQQLVQLLEQAGAGLMDGGHDAPPTGGQLPQQLQQVHGTCAVQPCQNVKLTQRAVCHLFGQSADVSCVRIQSLHCDVRSTSGPGIASSLQKGFARQAAGSGEIEGSPPEVGSSSSTIEGLISSSWPMDARLRSPPEMPLRKKPPARRLHSDTAPYPAGKHLCL